MAAGQEAWRGVGERKSGRYPGEVRSSWLAGYRWGCRPVRPRRGGKSSDFRLKLEEKGYWRSGSAEKPREMRKCGVCERVCSGGTQLGRKKALFGLEKRLNGVW